MNGNNNHNSLRIVEILTVVLLLACLSPLALGKKGGNGNTNGTSTGWNYLASLSGGSWDQVTAKQIWAVDGAAKLGGGSINIRDSQVYETTWLGIGPHVIYSNGQATGTGPVIGGYQITGMGVFPHLDSVTGEVYEIGVHFYSPDYPNHISIRAMVPVEPGVVPGEYPATLIPSGPFDMHLYDYQKGKLTEGPVVDTGYSMGPIDYTPLDAP